jgi:hypothetical protein
MQIRNCGFMKSMIFKRLTIYKLNFNPLLLLIILPLIPCCCALIGLSTAPLNNTYQRPNYQVLDIFYCLPFFVSLTCFEIAYMSRVFTMSFDCRNERHTAMVTMWEEQSGLFNYQIKLFNQELYHLIPEGKISFKSSDTTLPPQIQNRDAEALYLSLQQALTNYLSPKTTTALW